jgi:uncharacterized protein
VQSERTETIVENRLVTPPAQPASSMGSVALLKLLVARHPYATTLFFLVYWLALLLALGRLLAPVYRSISLPFLVYEAISELLLALIVALPIALLRWWPETGMTRGINGRGLLICLIPIVLIAGPSFLGLPAIIGSASGLVLVTALILSLLVGFAEEGMFRGVILSCLLPRGIWPAVLLSAFFFASTHLINLLSGASLGYVFAQMVLAFGIGVLFAALRLRTGSIWPAIVLHAAHDVVGLAYLGMNPASMSATPSSAAIVVNGVFCLLALLIAAILLRPRQTRKLEITYGLVKQSMAAFPSNAPLSYPGVIPYQQAIPPYQQGYPPYPTYGYQQQPAPPPGTFPQPHPGAIPYQEYTSPAAYGEYPQQPAPLPLNDAER